MKQLNLHKIFKALSSNQRLKLFNLILNCCEGRICKKEHQIYQCSSGMEKAFTLAFTELNLSKSTISHHMKELQNAGLINCTRKGQKFICEINYKALKMIQSFGKNEMCKKN